MSKAGKRIFDLFFAVPGFLLCAPFVWLAAAIIKLASPGPAFFRQTRVGKNGREFRLVKFRTMKTGAEAMGPPLTIGEDPRITRVGAFLRRTKLDEIPQLFNVLTGDMSLVGPRPEVPRYVAFYNEENKKVLDLVPGITDPASIAFCNESELLGESSHPEEKYLNEIMPAKIRLNLLYSRQATVCEDFKVILKTLKCLIG